MRYYLLNLAVHAVVLFVLIFGVCFFTKRNKKRKTKTVIGYFMPMLFALLAILDLAFITAPRLLDFNSVAARSYYYDTGVVTDVSYLKNYFTVDGKTYYINPMRLKIKVGDTVRIKHTQYSGFTAEVIDVTNSETLPSDSSQPQ